MRLAATALAAALSLAAPARASDLLVALRQANGRGNDLSQAVAVPASGECNLGLKADLRPARLRKGDC